MPAAPRAIVPLSVLATDYDGTLAHDGCVDAPTLAWLERGRTAGLSLILVTGRELPDLRRIFDRLELFDRIVAENGALLVDPRSGRRRPLGEAPPGTFVDRLRALGVRPLSVGEVVVATFRPHDTEVRTAIAELGLEHQVIFNKDAVMVLPPGVDKASGLGAALEELGHSKQSVVAVGDAENDEPLLRASQIGVAVANAVPELKARADLVLDRARGAGVSWLLEVMLDGSLAERLSTTSR